MKFGHSLIISSLLCFSTLQAEEIRIAASDLLAKFIEAPLLKFGAEHEIVFDIDGIGSLPALDRLRANEVDLAIIAVPRGSEVPRDEFNIFPFAYDAAIVAVHENNPLIEISLAQLAGIFGSNEESNFNTWGDLGLSGWGNRSIKMLSGAGGDSIALELFKHSAFRQGTMKSSVTVVSPREVEGLIGSDASSIAILSKMPTQQNVKVLMVSPDARSTAFGPSNDNVHYGDYPIRLAFYIAYNQRNSSRLERVIRALLGDEVATSLRSHDMLPLPDTVRQKLLADLDFEE
ncbi:MAG: hypothetical protein EA353_01215 [Puniceicoccaceae bacterium]|nr:MAG: hypothetical protein EA353_01215 [Puniceicoccaceae bacterium]